MKKLTCWLVRFFIIEFSVLPFRVIYIFSEVTFVFLFHVVRYRRKVVRKNLANSFPEKSPEEIKLLTVAFYHHFCDIILESLKAFSMNDEDLVERYRITNPELLDRFYDEKRSVIAVAGHYNNWEWGSIAACLQIRHHPVGFYKPIKNQCIDDYIRKNRERNGASIMSIGETSITFQNYRDRPSIFMMVADQNPSRVDLAHWKMFLNRKTAFLHGPEKHARISDLPVVYVDIEKVKRGYYTVTFRLLTEHPGEVPIEGITGMFAEELEKTIRQRPECWLWSHRRWKHAYSNPPLR